MNVYMGLPTPSNMTQMQHKVNFLKSNLTGLNSEFSFSYAD